MLFFSNAIISLFALKLFPQWSVFENDLIQKTAGSAIDAFIWGAAEERKRDIRRFLWRTSVLQMLSPGFFSCGLNCWTEQLKRCNNQEDKSVFSLIKSTFSPLKCPKKNVTQWQSNLPIIPIQSVCFCPKVESPHESLVLHACTYLIKLCWISYV